MPLSLPLVEPKTSDYIYIDEANHVHLLMPIVGGETIGIDNTCKTALEMQTFFYGRPPGDPSALQVLVSYEQALQADISFLEGSTRFPELLAVKRHRLTQIQGYKLMLRELRLKFGEEGSHPKFPAGVHALLARKTNCLTMHLSPKSVDNFLRTEAPAFSMTRPPRVMGPDGYFIIPPTDGYVGFGPNLRALLVTGLNAPRQAIISLKAQLISEAASHFTTKPTLEGLQRYLENKITERCGQRVDLRIAQDTTPVNEDYYMAVMAGSYAESSVVDAAGVILDACLTDDFWSYVSQTSLLTLGDVSDKEAEADRISILTQFFLAQINIYCKAHGLSSSNFGVIFEMETNLELVTKRITSALLKNENVEAVLFGLVHDLRPALLTRRLTAEEQRHIIQSFTTQYNTIKESPHFDEFIVFLPEVRGDFFNHKNRISVHFLDLVKYSSALFSPVERSTIERLLSEHHLRGNLAALKERPERKLSPNRPEFASTFQNFLDSINARTTSACATYLCSTIKKGHTLFSMLTFEELESLLNHPLWRSIEEDMKNPRSRTDHAKYAAAIDKAKYWVGLIYEKTFCPAGTPISPLMLDPLIWNNAVMTLQGVVTLYKSKFTYLLRIMSTERKAQIAELEEVLRELSSATNKTSRIKALSRAIKTFESMRVAIDSSSGLYESIIGLKAQILSLFALQDTPIGRTPLTALQAMITEENLQLGEWSQYHVLHGLKAEWWTARGIALIKQIPPVCYTEATIDCLNSILPTGLDLFVLKTLQTDHVQLGGDIPIATHRFRGQFLTYLGDEPQYAILRGLSRAWWGETQAEVLKTFLPANLTQAAITFLNKNGLASLDVDVLKTFQTEAINFADEITLRSLRERGVFLTYVDGLRISQPLKKSLRTLAPSWYEPRYIQKLVNFPSLPPVVITFLNTMQPNVVDNNILTKLRQRIVNGSLGTQPLTLLTLLQNVNTQRATNIQGLRAPPSLLEQIETAKNNYAKHVSYKWWDYKNRSHHKNTIIQRELNLAIAGLTTESTACLLQARRIIAAVKTTLEHDYGTRSWSWCLFRLQYSSRVLNELIEKVDQALPHATQPTRLARV